jgi:hypothetical protein
MLNDENPSGESQIATCIRIGDMTKPVRSFVLHSIESTTHPPGIYYFAIIGASCYFESVLEEFCSTFCSIKSSADKSFDGRIMEVIGQDVSRATGLEAWKKWIRTLFAVDIVNVVGDDWKGLDMLFKLRNQLAHGRTTKFKHFYDAETGKFLGMTTEGSQYAAVF